MKHFVNKILSLLLVFILLCQLCACGENKKESSNPVDSFMNLAVAFTNDCGIVTDDQIKEYISIYEEINSKGKVDELNTRLSDLISSCTLSGAINLAIVLDNTGYEDSSLKATIDKQFVFYSSSVFSNGDFKKEFEYIKTVLNMLCGRDITFYLDENARISLLPSRDLLAFGRNNGTIPSINKGEGRYKDNKGSGNQYTEYKEYWINPNNGLSSTEGAEGYYHYCSNVEYFGDFCIMDYSIYWYGSDPSDSINEDRCILVYNDYEVCEMDSIAQLSMKFISVLKDEYNSYLLVVGDNDITLYPFGNDPISACLR